MNKIAKQSKVEELKSLFASSGVILLARNCGLSVADAKAVRKAVRKDAGGRYFIAKNTLMRRAVQGTQYESLSGAFSGPIAVACGDDAVAIAKTMVNLSKDNNKLQLHAGAAAGEVLSLEHISALAALPSFEELRAKLLSVIQAPGRQIARAIALYSEKMAN